MYLRVNGRDIYQFNQWIVAAMASNPSMNQCWVTYCQISVKLDFTNLSLWEIWKCLQFFFRLGYFESKTVGTTLCNQTVAIDDLMLRLQRLILLTCINFNRSMDM